MNKLGAASAAYGLCSWQPEFQSVIPQMNVEMILGMPFHAAYRKLAPNPEGFRALANLIAFEHQPMAWEADVAVLVITGDADVATLEHSVALFRLLGGGGEGDMGRPLAAPRLAVCRRPRTPRSPTSPTCWFP